MHIALTGATGLLGRNVLFEFLKQHLTRSESLHITILGRSAARVSLQARAEDLLASDGDAYLGGAQSDAFANVDVRFVEMDLARDDLGIAPDDVQVLRRAPVDHFIHIAAVTDFRDIKAVHTLLRAINVGGTQKVLALAAAIQAREFVYVGSAYACGCVDGTIPPYFINRTRPFRNVYEQTKRDAELAVRQFCRQTGLKYRCFRPSTICGRLIEQPTGATHKFDVFYGWAGFFLRAKLAMVSAPDRYTKPVHLDFRVCYSADAGLNIVPADYAAKVMYHVITQDHPERSFHLVNERETPHSLYVPLMAQALGIRGMQRVDSIPEDLNDIEALYYRTAGALFTPYVTSPHMGFDTSNLTSVLAPVDLCCPTIDEARFKQLMAYATAADFGLGWAVRSS